MSQEKTMDKVKRLLEIGEKSYQSDDYRLDNSLYDFLLGYGVTRSTPTGLEELPELCEEFEEAKAKREKQKEIIEQEDDPDRFRYSEEDFEKFKTRYDREVMLRAGELAASLKNLNGSSNLKGTIESVLEENISNSAVEGLKEAEFR